MISQQTKVFTRRYLHAVLNIEGELKSQLDVEVIPYCTDRTNRMDRAKMPRIANHSNGKDSVPSSKERKITFASETRPRGQSRPLIENFAVDVQVINSLKSESQPIRAWANWCYTDKPRYEDIEDFIFHAWDQLVARLSLKLEGRGKLSKPQVKRIQSLLFLAAYEVKYRATHGNRKKYTAQEIKRLGSYTDSSWKDRWRERWQACVAVLTELDTQSLEKVEQLIEHHESILYPDDLDDY